MHEICIFSGTTEGRQLARRLCGRGIRVAVCTATEYGGELNAHLPDAKVYAGRMNSAEMAAFLKANRFSSVVDATHPYAAEATQNLRHACEQTQTEYLRVIRRSDADGQDGVFVPDANACLSFLKGTQGNILLTTGSKDLPAFCQDESIRRRLYVRVLPLPASLQVCAECGIEPSRIIAMQGPFDEALNTAMLRSVNARYLITKDTGSSGGYESKIRAAMQAGAQAVIIGRPTQETGYTVDELAARLEDQYRLSPIRRQVTLIGAGMGDEGSRTVGMQRAMEEAECIIGSRRLLDLAIMPEKPRREAVKTEEIVRIIKDDPANRRFAVLLSGDTGFFSGAKRLIRALDDMDVRVLPGVGSLSCLCARIGRSWEDVYAISLHGRSGDIIQAVRTHPAVFALLDGKNTASHVLQMLCTAGYGHLKAWVGERLGYANERISCGKACELASESFDALSVLLVENASCGGRVVTHGLADDAFERGEAPMTKSEVRSISLSKLQLTQGAVVYDVGAGSGSVAVEAALQATAGMVYAVEMKPEAAALTRQNQKRFHLSNLQVVCGKAPEALEKLPSPTHVFIGGSCGSLRAILDCILKKNPHVRIVANAVTLETLAELSTLATEFDFSEAVQISVAKARPVGAYHLMRAHNPVYIFTLQNGGDHPHE